MLLEKNRCRWSDGDTDDSATDAGAATFPCSISKGKERLLFFFCDPHVRPSPVQHANPSLFNHSQPANKEMLSKAPASEADTLSSVSEAEVRPQHRCRYTYISPSKKGVRT